MSDELIAAQQDESSALEVAPPQSIEATIAKLADRGDPDSVEVLERLIALQERMEGRAKDAERKAAIIAAVQDIPPIHRLDRAKNSNYASLERIQGIVDPILARHGLSYRWDRKKDDGDRYVVFILEHENGTEEERSRMLDAVDEAARNRQGNSIRPAIQDVGSGDSYLSRYTLVRGLKIRLGGEDDDGESSEPYDRVTDAQVLEIEAALEAMGEGKDQAWKDRQYANLLRANAISGLGDLPAVKFDSVIAILRRRAAGGSE